MIRMNCVARFFLCLCVITNSWASDTWVVGFEGVGPVKIGMNLSQLNSTLHEKYSVPDGKDERGCFFVDVSKHPEIALMIIQGRLARLDVRKPGVFTAEGIQVGDSESRALMVYGHRLKVEPHFYVDTGHYLTVRSKDGHFGIRFETDQGMITMYYAGRYDVIQYVEGCS
jgi:hypothetical protein